MEVRTTHLIPSANPKSQVQSTKPVVACDSLISAVGGETQRQYWSSGPIMEKKKIKRRGTNACVEEPKMATGKEGTEGTPRWFPRGFLVPGDPRRRG